MCGRNGRQWQDLPEISASLRKDSCHEAAAALAPVEEAFHDVELEQLEEVFPPTVELSDFTESQAERRAEVPMDSPKEEKASTMQMPHASRFIGLGGLGNTISFDYHPHPDEKTEKEAKQLTEEVLQTLMNSWNSTKELGSVWVTEPWWSPICLILMQLTLVSTMRALFAPYYMELVWRCLARSVAVTPT